MHQFVIRIKGDLPSTVHHSFDGLTVTPASAQTVLSGDLPDQAALSEVLERLDELGVRILGVVKLPADARAASDELELTGDAQS